MSQSRCGSCGATFHSTGFFDLVCNRCKAQLAAEEREKERKSKDRLDQLEREHQLAREMEAQEEQEAVEENCNVIQDWTRAYQDQTSKMVSAFHEVAVQLSKKIVTNQKPDGDTLKAIQKLDSAKAFEATFKSQFNPEMEAKILVNGAMGNKTLSKEYKNCHQLAFRYWLNLSFVKFAEIVCLINFPELQDEIGKLRFEQKQEDASAFIKLRCNFYNGRSANPKFVTEKEDEIVLYDILEMLFFADNLAKNIREMLFQLVVEIWQNGKSLEKFCVILLDDKASKGKISTLTKHEILFACHFQFKDEFIQYAKTAPKDVKEFFVQKALSTDLSEFWRFELKVICSDVVPFSGNCRDELGEILKEYDKQDEKMKKLHYYLELPMAEDVKRQILSHKEELEAALMKTEADRTGKREPYKKFLAHIYKENPDPKLLASAVVSMPFNKSHWDKLKRDPEFSIGVIGSKGFKKIDDSVVCSLANLKPAKAQDFFSEYLQGVGSKLQMGIMDDDKVADIPKFEKLAQQIMNGLGMAAGTCAYFAFKQNSYVVATISCFCFILTSYYAKTYFGMIDLYKQLNQSFKTHSPQIGCDHHDVHFTWDPKVNPVKRYPGIVSASFAVLLFAFIAFKGSGSSKMATGQDSQQSRDISSEK